METLGARLKRFRLENGWSKSRVAKKLDVSIPSIMRWEEDIALPNDYNRFKIERMLIEKRPGESSAKSTIARLEQLPLFPELGIKPHAIP
ncbi:helix-turn-helix domain-containing protein [Candidatus Bipolaricaulota bacterium]|nr:helix-turn-helix domain-containing protein [Candidatus Bipolaricaulota bacterium]